MIEEENFAKFADERRQWPRIDTTFPALYADDRGHFCEDEVVNLSKGGLFLKTQKPLKHGEKLELILTLPDHSSEVTVQGEVMYSTPITPENIVTGEISGNGIMFTTVEPQLKKWLGDFIDRLLNMDGGGYRQVPRVCCKAAEIILKISDGDENPAILGNLSQKGLFLRTASPLSLFEEVRIRLIDPNKETDFTLKGEVVHVQKVKDDEEYGVGIRFTDLPAEAQETVLSLIRDIMFSQKGPALTASSLIAQT